uniref:Uncharacterized protein n=1 Tax=Anguilla anguilla TaxID=7936 RepID=A0A0E9S7Y0_ANGAN
MTAVSVKLFPRSKNNNVIYCLVMPVLSHLCFKGLHPGRRCDARHGTQKTTTKKSTLNHKK